VKEGGHHGVELVTGWEKKEREEGSMCGNNGHIFSFWGPPEP